MRRIGLVLALSLTLAPIVAEAQPPQTSEPRRLSRRPGYVSVASSTEAEW